MSDLEQEIERKPGTFVLVGDSTFVRADGNTVVSMYLMLERIEIQLGTRTDKVTQKLMCEAREVLKKASRE